MEFPRQEYWSGLAIPFSRGLPNQGLNLGLLHYRQILYHLSHQGSPGKLGRNMKEWIGEIKDSLKKKDLFVYLLAVLGSHCFAWAFSSCGERGLCFVACTGFSLLWLLFLQSSRQPGFGSCSTWAQWLQCAGSVAVVHGLCCSTARRIFLDQGSNQCPLCCKADSLPLDHQGVPQRFWLYTLSSVEPALAWGLLRYHIMSLPERPGGDFRG